MPLSFKKSRFGRMLAARRRRLSVLLRLEIAAMFHIGNQSRLLGLPAQAFSSPLTGPRNVSHRKMRKPAEMLVRFLGSLADDRNLQTIEEMVGGQHRVDERKRAEPVRVILMNRSSTEGRGSRADEDVCSSP